MSESALAYAAVTPARDEAANIRRLAECLVEQRLRPAEWIVVDDGSTDDTRAVVEEISQRHPWIRLVSSPGPASRPGDVDQGRNDGRDVVAFKAGVSSLRAPLPDIVVKLDADVSMGPDFFERLVKRFTIEASLGIASGTCYEFSHGSWRPQNVARGHVRGATRAYRWSCFQAVAPLVERLGWDGIDELKANVNGWKTRSLVDLPFFHHRPVGHRDGRWQGWLAQGDTAYFLGYRFPYLVFRALHYSVRRPAAFAMILGFVSAALRRVPQYDETVVVAHLRQQQRLRSLPFRVQEKVIARIRPDSGNGSPLSGRKRSNGR